MQIAVMFLLSLPINFFNNQIKNLAVHNLSGHDISHDALAFLGRGLSFIPTPAKPSWNFFSKSIDRFVRGVRIAYHFGTQDQSEEPDLYDPESKKVYFRSTWVPNAASARIEKFLKKLTDKLKAKFEVARSLKLKNNICWSQRSAAKALISNPLFTISGTDKNLGIAIHTTECYNAHAREHLKQYQVLTEQDARKRVGNFYRTAKKLFKDYGIAEESNLFKFLTNNINCSNFSWPKFFLLWKIHKPKLASRPITPCKNYISTCASKWLDYVLQPVVKELPTYLKDSQSLVLDLEVNSFPANSVLSAKDVANLYPSIPIEDGVRRVEAVLEDHKNLIRDGTSIDLIIKILLLIMQNQIVEFANELFLQLDGTATGTPAAVVFAILFMFSIEIDLVNDYQGRGWLYYFKRYIDDIIAIFASPNAAAMFWRTFNSLHPNIKVTGDDWANEIVFMDMIVLKGPRFVETGNFDLKIYQKHLNNYLYLPFSSFHTEAQRSNFIGNELVRYIIRCSSKLDFLVVRKAFYHRLRMRGIPRIILQPLFKKIVYSNRQNYIAKISQVKDPMIELPIFFNVQWNSVSKEMNLPEIIYNEWELAEHSIPEMSFIKKKPMVTFSRAPNIKNLITPLPASLRNRQGTQ